jgi:hypothetical protein
MLMAFLSTFVGMMAALLIWVGVYNFLIDADAASLNALAVHFEAMSVGGIGLFVFLGVAFSLLTYRVLKRKRQS